MNPFKHNRVWLSVLSLALAAGLFLTACTGNGDGAATTTTTAGTTTPETTTEATTQETTTVETTEASKPATELPTEDRVGNPLSLEAPAETVAVMAPAYAQIIEGLGALDRIILVDTNTPMAIPALSELPQMDLFAPNVETLIADQPDVILASSISMSGGTDDPFQQAEDAGIAVAYIPTADSLNDIVADIRFIGAVLGLADEAEAMAEDYEENLQMLADIAETLTTRKTVLFEVAPAPDLYSFGSGVYLNEMLAGIGAINILADQEGWLPVTEEAALAANPDAIFTSANWQEDPVQDILDRQAWQDITALQEKDVYYIENKHTQLPSQKVVEGMLEMAQAIYPEAYADVTLR